MFEIEFPSNTNNPLFECSLDRECEVPRGVESDVFLKIFRTGASHGLEPVVVHLQEEQFFEPDCPHEVLCMCTGFPCPCDLYLYPSLTTYSLVKLKKAEKFGKDPYLMRALDIDESDAGFGFNSTHVKINRNGKEYAIGYKRLNGDATQRTYSHLSRYGDQVQRGFSVRSGKYALGSNEKTEVSLSRIRKVYRLESDLVRKYVVTWTRDQMKTLITIPKKKDNQWKVETLSAAESGKFEDLYLEVSAPHIQNDKSFFTDSNGWLVMRRELYKHEDYQAYFCAEGFDNVNGNSYPITAFAYIQDSASKLSVNSDRAQGVIALRPGTLWLNFDRLSSDDGKWVYENTYRSEYQKFVHHVTVDNADANERALQKMRDEPLVIQGSAVSSSERVTAENHQLTSARSEWETKTGINDVKFQVRPYNDSSVLLRVFSMREDANTSVELFSADKVCTFLTAYYGNQVKFSEAYETSLGGNMKYEQFVAGKWNWHQVVNLTRENQIFDKEFG